KGGWRVDIQPGGRDGKRFRKTLGAQSEAKRYEAWVIANYSQNKDWNPGKKDKRSLRGLVDLWYESHGKSLRDGSGRKRWLLQICAEIGNPSAASFSATDFTSWRAGRLESGSSINTVNNALAYFRALFSELIRLNEWTVDSPVANIRQIKRQDTELSFLSLEQLIDLIVEFCKGDNPDTRLVTLICLSTGARWSEAEGLRWSQVGKGKITFEKTKSGKARALPITDCIQRSLEARYKAVQPERSDRIFCSCYSSFREAVDRAGIILPKGQLTHVLRHTFASHFMTEGGNILVLQRALGHGSLQMTMRYAHFAPDHLEEVRMFNPLG
ncbi:MAG: tyrosine-type recombinase/integrase, partial [Sedimenticola sp.]